jgi:uncharacterized protein (DUF697 family)
MTTRAAQKSTHAASAGKLVTYLLEQGLGGVGPLSSAEQLAQDYLGEPEFANHDERVDALVNWESTKNFTTGFLTGLGGAITLPVAIPSALGASWLLQARLAGAIARIYGHDLSSDRVRTMILLSLAGDVAKEAMKGIGIPLSGGITQSAINRVPGRLLVEINKRIGARLVTKAGERSLVNLSKAVPIVGGVIGGAFDAMVCRMVGRTAKQLFQRPAGAVIEGEIVAAREE